MTGLTYYPQESWESSRHAADQLGLDTKLEDEVATIIVDAECILDKWTKRRSMLLLLEELPRRAQDAAMEVEEAEHAVVPAAEGRGASSEVQGKWYHPSAVAQTDHGLAGASSRR